MPVRPIVGAVVLAVVLMGGIPLALASPPTPGPGASLPTKAKAYGEYCQDQRKKRVPGQKGTPFSQCVTAMAKLATVATDSPREACKALSRTHVQGEKGTPFSRCVAAGAKLLKDRKGQKGA